MARVPRLILWLLLTLAVLIPAIDTLTHLRAAAFPIPTSTDLERLLRSLVYAGAIATLGTLIAIPASWHLRGCPRAAWPVLPLLLPNYLIYAGCQRLIAPGTALGDFLARGPATGENWWPLAAARSLAVLALAAWSWPLAFLVLREFFTRLDDSILSALRMDAPRLARARAILRLAAPGLLAGGSTVALVTLGSAIPLHLAQVDSYALSLWTRLSLASPADLAGVWLAAWPCALVAIVGAFILSGHFARPTEPAHPATPRPRRWLAQAYLLTLVAPPLALLVFELHGPSAFPRFWRLHADALANSLLVASTLGLLAALAACAAWAACAWSSRRGLRVVLVLALAWALLPGVLIGQAWASLCVRPWFPLALADSPVPAILAQCGRFLPVALLAGIALARADAPLRDVRRLDDACRPRAFLAEFRMLAPVALAAGAACFALSLHEIEATVMVQPPGYDSLARRMLEMLHYQRMEMLATGVLLISCLGCLATVPMCIRVRRGR